jgi:hypothetical protein
MVQRLQLEWEEDEATLKQCYLSEKDAQNRTRLQALWQLQRGRMISSGRDSWQASLDHSRLDCLVSVRWCGRCAGAPMWRAWWQTVPPDGRATERTESHTHQS